MLYLSPANVQQHHTKCRRYHGGQLVTITGSGLFGTSLAVTIGGSPATGVTWGSSTSITAVTPSGTAGSATWVNITNSNGGMVNTSAAYTYVTMPMFASIMPSTFSISVANW